MSCDICRWCGPDDICQVLSREVHYDNSVIPLKGNLGHHSIQTYLAQRCIFSRMTVQPSEIVASCQVAKEACSLANNGIDVRNNGDEETQLKLVAAKKEQEIICGVVYPPPLHWSLPVGKS